MGIGRRLAIVIAFLLLIGNCGYGRLKTKFTPDGALVFIDKLQAKVCKPAKGDNMKYEYTLVSISDSVRVTSTLLSKEKMSIDSVLVSSPGTNVKSAAHKIYIEPKGSGWLYRLEFYMPWAEFVAIAAEPSVKFCWSGSREVNYLVDEKAQAAIRKELVKAIDIIEQNK